MGNAVRKVSTTITAYHFTSAEEFGSFKQLSHFGTLNAAVTMSVNCGRQPQGPERIIAVELAFRKLFHMTYEEAEDDAKLWRQCTVHGKYPELAKAWEDEVTSIQALKKLGYDGIAYSNTYDDDGSDSYIIFYPEQVIAQRVLVSGRRNMRRFQRKHGWEPA